MSFTLEEIQEKQQALADLLLPENFSKLSKDEQDQLVDIAERFQREANVYSTQFPQEEEEFGYDDEGRPLGPPWVNVSLTRMDEEYQKKFMVTALTAFLFRACDEWEVPRNVPVVPVADFERNPNILEELKPKPVGDNDSIPADMEESYEFNARKMLERQVVHRFLKHVLSFNPDQHVRGSYFPNARDKSRKPVTTDGAVQCLVKEERMRRKKKNGSKYERKRAKQDLEYVQHAASEAPETKRGTQLIRYRMGEVEVEQRVPVDDPSAEVQMATPEQWEALRPQLTDVTLSQTAREHIPPGDFYYRLNIFSRSNYEALKATVRDIYGDCSDYESAVFVTKPFESAKKAREYINLNSSRLRTNFDTVQTQSWAILAPVKGNRDKLDTEGPNGVFINEVLLRAKQDEEVAGLMIKKRIKDCKRDQRKRDGPNSKKISEFSLTQIQRFIQDHREEDSDSDEEVEVKVTHMKKGGLEVDQESFKTSYTAQISTH